MLLLVGLVPPQTSHIKMGSQEEAPEENRWDGQSGTPPFLGEDSDPYSRSSYLHLRSPFPNRSPSGVKQSHTGEIPRDTARSSLSHGSSLLS